MANKNISTLKSEIATLLPDNSVGAVSVADVRGTLIDIVDSVEGQDGARGSRLWITAGLPTVAGLPNALSGDTAFRGDTGEFYSFDGTTWGQTGVVLTGAPGARWFETSALTAPAAGDVPTARTGDLLLNGAGDVYRFVDATNGWAATGINVKGPKGDPGPAGPAGGFAYRAAADLGFTAVTSPLASATSWAVTLLTQTFEGPIFAGIPFRSEYSGFLYLDVASNGNYEVTLKVTHNLQDGTSFPASRTFVVPMRKSELHTIPLNSFSSTTPLPEGEHRAPDGTTVEITQELLNQPVEIVFELCLARSDGAAFVLDAASMVQGAAEFTQQALGTVQLAKGEPGSTIHSISSAPPASGLGAPGDWAVLGTAAEGAQLWEKVAPTLWVKVTDATRVTPNGTPEENETPTALTGARIGSTLYAVPPPAIVERRWAPHFRTGTEPKVDHAVQSSPARALVNTADLPTLADWSTQVYPPASVVGAHPIALGFRFGPGNNYTEIELPYGEYELMVSVDAAVTGSISGRDVSLRTALWAANGVEIAGTGAEHAITTTGGFILNAGPFRLAGASQWAALAFSLSYTGTVLAAGASVVVTPVWATLQRTA